MHKSSQIPHGVCARIKLWIQAFACIDCALQVPLVQEPHLVSTFSGGRRVCRAVEDCLQQWVEVPQNGNCSHRTERDIIERCTAAGIQRSGGIQRQDWGFQELFYSHGMQAEALHAGQQGFASCQDLFIVIHTLCQGQ